MLRGIEMGSLDCAIEGGTGFIIGSTKDIRCTFTPANAEFTPENYFGKVVHTSHQAIETQVTQGVLDAGADYNRNRTAMIEQGLIKPERSKIIWTSAPLPNDAFAVSKALAGDAALIRQLQGALSDVGEALKTRPDLLPPHYTGFVSRDNAFYKPIRDAGLATGKLQVK